MIFLISIKIRKSKFNRYLDNNQLSGTILTRLGNLKNLLEMLNLFYFILFIY